jgi:hypothetical protein
MTFRFPLKDVKTEISSDKRVVACPVYSDHFYRVSQDEFSMDVEGVASFYVSGGDFISLVPDPAAKESSIELYLNGSAYGAILHQRKILPLHGSCFLFNGKGVMICGDAGVGKSALTASFCLNGAEFLTDDVTPMVFPNRVPHIWSLSDRIKLWGDTLKQLEKKEDGLHRIYPDTEKFYYPLDNATGSTYKLDQVYILEITDTESIEIEELSGSSKFIAMRSEIYRQEYLKGMPENELVYFRNLVDISNCVRIFRVKRPGDILIRQLMDAVKKYEIFDIK